MNFEAQNESSPMGETRRTTRRQVSKGESNRVCAVLSPLNLLCCVALMIFTSGCWSDHWANWQGVNISQSNAYLAVTPKVLSVTRTGNNLTLSTPGPFSLQQAAAIGQWNDLVTATNSVTVPMTNGISVFGVWLQCDPLTSGTGINLYVDGVKIQEGMTTNFMPTFGPGEHTFYVTAYDANGNESLKSNMVLASGYPISGSTFYRAKYQ